MAKTNHSCNHTIPSLLQTIPLSDIIQDMVPCRRAACSVGCFQNVSVRVKVTEYKYRWGYKNLNSIQKKKIVLSVSVSDWFATR
jgi:hypothetical protein